ncbi:pendrin-like isoform X2 [Bacillus rossius redtenbacheri]|uniref:pendrin-like isoform X2 n=1 Tax=Bacillus rossius redtenbacheri TaxID=93214 RepID=UPI002FDCC14E
MLSLGSRRRSSNWSAIDPSCTLRVERPVYRQDELNKAFDYIKPRRKLGDIVTDQYRTWRPLETLLRMVPVLSWMRHYRWREDLVSDLVSGFTVAIMNIPQGMATALLGNVPPIVGIYMAFFPVLTYFLLGTSRHVSMGTFAVVCMLTGQTVTQYAAEEPPALPGNNGTAALVNGDLPVYSPVQVATAVAFMVGIYQVVMHVFRLGVVCTLLSDTLVNAFTTASAVHVFTSQVKDLMGLDISRYQGVFKVVYTWIEIFKEITTTNVAAVVMSAVTILVLVTNDYMKPYVKKVSKLPVPIELVVVVAGTLVSAYTSITLDYGIVMLGDIPRGLPPPTPPPFSLMADVALDSFTIAVVSYTISMSMALTFAQKLGYSVDANQELLAQGAGNVVGSFFSCMPFCASLSRSLVQQTVGGRTQLASVVSCGILLLVMLWIGPFFEPLPRCVLASIIVVALKGLLMQVSHVVKFWRLSVLDGVVWLVTFLTVVLVSIDLGLLAGVAISLVCIFIQSMKPYTCLLGVVPNTDLYLDLNRYKGTPEVAGVKIFHYCGGLNFATRDHFRGELLRLVGVDPQTELRRRRKQAKKEAAAEQVSSIVLDFSALSYVDPSGVNLLKLLREDYAKIGVSIYLAGSSCPVYENLKKCGFLGDGRASFKIFPTVHDAILYVQNRTQSRLSRA